MANIKIIVNTKGGVGKSIIAQNVLPLFFPDNRIYEVDNNNISELDGVSSYSIKESETVLDMLDISVLKDNKTINIVDVGGGDDTVEFLKNLKREELGHLCDFFIPANKDYSQFKNITDTISLIRNVSPKASITLILNRCNDLEEFEQEFYNIFGNEDYGIDSRYEMIGEDLRSVIVLPETPIFSILEGKYKMSFPVALEWANDMIKNLKKYKQEWIKEGDEVFIKNKKELRFAQSVKVVENYIMEFQKDFLGEK